MVSKPDRRIVNFIVAVVLAALPLLANGQTSLNLADALRMAQEHSFGIKSARSDSLSSMYDYYAARAGRLPTLSLAATGFYINKLQSITLPFIGSRSPGIKDNYQADLRMSVPLFAGGRISNQVRFQREIVNNKSYALLSRQLDNAYQVRRAFLGLMASQAVRRATLASLDRLDVVRRDVQNLYNAGLADSVDILDAEIAFERSSQSLDEKKTAEKNAALALARLIGLAENDSIIAVDSIPIPDFAIYKDIKPSLGDIHRPEINAMQSRVQAAELAARLNGSNYFPMLSGFGGYSYGKPNKDLFNHTWNDFWTAGLNLNWEFNLGGRTIYNVRSAKESAASAQLSKKDLEESLLLGAKSALENLSLAYNSYLALGRQYGLSQREFTLAENQERAGRLAANRVLELEANLTSTEQSYRAAQINYYISETEYLYTVGSPKIFGGF